MLQKGDYRKLFESPDGRRVLEDLERMSGFNGNPFDTKSERNTCYNLGQRRILLYIHQKINEKDEPQTEVINE